MPSRFIVSWAARAVGITVARSGRGDLDQDVGGDRLDFGHDDVRPLLLDQALQRGGVGHRDHVRAVRDLVARRVRVAVDGDGFHAQALQRDDDFLAEFAAAEQHDAGGGRGQRCADVHEDDRGVGCCSAILYCTSGRPLDNRRSHGRGLVRAET